jgi:hypothetical protein
MLVLRENANVSQVCLILLAACIYTSTSYGFGMRLADIKASGGDPKKAMKVGRPRTIVKNHPLT